MTDLLDQGIVINEDGSPRLNGPRVVPDGSGNLWVWAAMVREQVFTVGFVLPLGVEVGDPMFVSAKTDGLTDLHYAIRYMTTGCQADPTPRPHRFMGSPQDLDAVLVCLDCPVVKKRGVALPGVVDMRGGPRT